MNDYELSRRAVRIVQARYGGVWTERKERLALRVFRRLRDGEYIPMPERHQIPQPPEILGAWQLGSLR